MPVDEQDNKPKKLKLKLKPRAADPSTSQTAPPVNNNYHKPLSSTGYQEPLRRSSTATHAPSVNRQQNYAPPSANPTKPLEKAPYQRTDSKPRYPQKTGQTPTQGQTRPSTFPKKDAPLASAVTTKSGAANPTRRAPSARQTQQYKKDSVRETEAIALSKMERTRYKNRTGQAVIPSEIEIGEIIQVSELAKRMNLKVGELMQRLVTLGVMVTINDNIDSDTATLVADEFGCHVTIKNAKEEITIVTEESNPANLAHRAPIVTIMGHVDHGKTQLLDAIRDSNVVSKESGGITQHIGAYSVTTPHGKITFLDTPGHEAFTAMRARGAQVTDIVILVVSAEEGPKPQTIEAMNHAKAAQVPIIVAVNKMDLPNANLETTKQRLAEYDLLPEDWGGDTPYLPVSALARTGLSQLLEAVLLQADIMELKADPTIPAHGYVIESKVEMGRGTMATLIITKGTLDVGTYFVVGTTFGKVRAMFNAQGERVVQAGPSEPVEIMGFQGIPQAGDEFYAVASDEFAREMAAKRSSYSRLEKESLKRKQLTQSNMERMNNPLLKEYKVIVKADVQGSVEAIQHALLKMKNDEIKIVIIHSGVGAVTESDVMLASATSRKENSDAVLILAFRVRIDGVAKERSESEHIDVQRFNVIYDLVNYAHTKVEGLLAPEVSETSVGTAEIKQIFKVTGVGKVAGCLVQSGFIRKVEKVRIFREGIQVWDGSIRNLKRVDVDSPEVQEGIECGLSFVNYEDIRVGDVIECYHVKESSREFVYES